MTSIALISKSPLEDSSKDLFSVDGRPLTTKKASPAFSSVVNPIIPESSESSDIKILSNSSKAANSHHQLAPSQQASKDRQNSLKEPPSKAEIASGAGVIEAEAIVIDDSVKDGEAGNLEKYEEEKVLSEDGRDTKATNVKGAEQSNFQVKELELVRPPL